MAVDEAIAQALNVSKASVTIARHGSSGFTSTSKISVSRGGGEADQHFFLKTAPGLSAKVMFEGEHASLQAIHSAVPSLCPDSVAVGELEDSPGTYFLLTEFIHVDHGSAAARRSGSSNQGSPTSLAQKLARLHSTPVPPPSGSSDPAFGFPVTTCCGDTPQPNEFNASWAEFYAEQRLLAVLAQHEAAHGQDNELRALVERTTKTVVPRLLGDGHLGGSAGIVPVVVHGDLWSGNRIRGRVIRNNKEEDRAAAENPTEDLVFDPSSCYAHSEYELGIMHMFGGFGGDFLREYHSLLPKTEPAEEYADRVTLYELYHHLNHTAIFGGSYRAGAASMMRGLLQKYEGSD